MRMCWLLPFSKFSVILLSQAMRTTGNFGKKFMNFPNIKTPLIAPFVEEKITIPNPSSFIEKVHRLKQNNNQIQFISDFDYTLTKFRHQGVQCDSLFGMWVKGEHLPAKFKQALISNYQEFGPYETDGTISFQDRAYLIHQLYKNQLKAFEKFRITEEMVEQVMNHSNLVYRSHTVEFLNTLESYQIPMYVISGGISDLIFNFNQAISKKEYSNISIHSNELETYTYSMPDDASEFDPRFIKFRKQIVHSFNKYKVMNHQNKRKNCVLMGDLVSDIYMAEGNNYENILSVFYGKEGENDQRALAEKKFDIIVEGDCSHRILIELLKVIYGKQGVDWAYLYSTSSNLHQLLI